MPRALITAVVVVVAVGIGMARVAAAQPHPTLDDFYDRTRGRADGFERCIGYCDDTWLAGFLVGAQTANPSTDAIDEKLATGARLGIDLGVRGGYANIARTKLWADVLRVNETGDFITDLAWQTTGFAAFGKPGKPGLHLSADALVARRTELQPSDLAELRAAPYRMVDVELEAAATGPSVDGKGTFLAFPVGVASRLRWDDGGRFERRTSVSGAVAFRGFPEGLRHHDQLDVLRVKYTDWSTGASSWTMSLGYQRLSPGVPWLDIWLLAGYEWAGDRHGPVVQLGAETHFETEHGRIEIGPALEEHLELDPRTAMFTRVYQGRLYARHHVGRVRWGVAYEVIAVENRGRLDAVTPELAVAVHGVELGVRYRLARVTEQPMAGTPGDRFNLSLDWLF